MATMLPLITTLAVHHLLFGCALLAALLLLFRIIRVSAEFQSWLWLTAFAVATLLPLFLMDTEAKAEVTRNLSVVQINHQVNTGTENHRQPVAYRSKSRNAVTDQGEWTLSADWLSRTRALLVTLAAVWLFGALWRLAHMYQSWLRTLRIVRSARPLTAGHPLGQYSETPILAGDHFSSPMTSGLLRPVILLPSSMMQQLSTEQLAPVILHENAHIERGDLWFGVAQEIIASLFWWSPVVRTLNRRIHLNRELACDIRAAQQLDSNQDYAQSLLDCAKLMLFRHQNILAMGLFSRRKELAHRIQQVLHHGSGKGPGKILVASACLLLTVFTASTANSFAPRFNFGPIAGQSGGVTGLRAYEGRKLVAAVRNDDLALIRQMRSDGLDINAPVPGDGTALMVAVRRNNRSLVEALVQMGADLNQPASGDGNPLIIAAKSNNLPLAKYLVARGADVNAFVLYDETPLINAASNGHLDMTRWLVEQGADVNLKVRSGNGDGNEIRSPLNMAKDPAVRTYLLGLGATE